MPPTEQNTAPIKSFNHPNNSVWGGTRYFLHFGDKQTEAPSSEIICQSPGARNRQKQDLNRGLSTARACAVDSMSY